MTDNNEFERSIGRLEGKMDSMVAAMSHLSQSFDNLEKGRLSTLEINFARLHSEVTEKARNSSVWTSAIISIIVGIAVYYLTSK